MNDILLLTPIVVTISLVRVHHSLCFRMAAADNRSYFTPL
jgi:hypothetical protein